MTNHSVCIVEDNELVSDYLKMQIEELDYHVAGIYRSAEDVMQILDSTKVDIVLMDVFLAGKMDGITAAKIIHDLKKIPVIIISSHIDADILDKANKSFVFNYLLKPINNQQLQAALILATHQHKHELKVSETYNEVISHLADGNIRMALFNHTQERLREYEKNLLLDGDQDHFFENIITIISELTGALYGAIVILNDDQTVKKFFT